MAETSENKPDTSSVCPPRSLILFLNTADCVFPLSLSLFLSLSFCKQPGVSSHLPNHLYLCHLEPLSELTVGTLLQLVSLSLRRQITVRIYLTLVAPTEHLISGLEDAKTHFKIKIEV